MSRRAGLLALLLALAAGCPYRSKPPGPEPAPRDPLAALVAAVGSRPRVAASLSLDAPIIRTYLDDFEQLPPMLGGRTLEACGVQRSALGQLRVAIGEPMVVAAELDGKIDRKQAQCILGADLMRLLREAGVALRDRPGGLAISYTPPASARAPSGAGKPGAAPAAAAGDALIRRCAGKPACATARLGPTGKELWLNLLAEDRGITWRLDGPGLSRPAADAFVAAVKEVAAKHPELAQISVRSGGGELSWTLTADPEPARILKEQLLEAFKQPSISMLPTLRLDDHFFIAKGPLRGPITPGTVVVYRVDVEGTPRMFIKRVIAVGGQTVTETADGIAIDGVPLATELVDARYRFEDEDPSTGEVVVREARLLRERLGDRSYQILRTREGDPRSWTVPSGHYFVLGDHRDNSNDSRYTGAVAEQDIVGRVIGLWLAWRGKIPDWDRIGTGIE